MNSRMQPILTAGIYLLFTAGVLLWAKLTYTDPAPLSLQAVSPYVWVGEFETAGGVEGFIQSGVRTYIHGHRLYHLYKAAQEGIVVAATSSLSETVDGTEAVPMGMQLFVAVPSPTASEPSWSITNEQVTLLYIDKTSDGHGIFKSTGTLKPFSWSKPVSVLDKLIVENRTFQHLHSPIIFSCPQEGRRLLMLARETNTSKVFLVETAYPPLPHSPVAVVDLEVPSGVALINVGSLQPALDNSEAEVPFVLNVRFESGREPQPGRRDIEGYGLLRRKFGDWAVEWASPVVGGERLFTRLDKGGVYFTGITSEDIYYAVCPDQRQLNARLRIGSTGVVQKMLNVTGLDRMTKLLHAKKPLAAMLNQL